MDNYKEYIHRLRRLSLEEIYLLLNDNITPNLKNYVHLLNELKFDDGLYHTLYGEIKKISNSFMNYFSSTMDSVIQEADRCSNLIDKDELIELMANTISLHQQNQVEFGREYLPITNTNEKQIYEEIEHRYNIFMDELYQLKDKLENLNHKNKIYYFAQNHFQITVKNTSEILHFTQDFLAMMLADRLNQIRVSLEEILCQIRNNLRRVQKENEENINALLNQLYEKNKEHLALSRRDRLCSMESAEVSRSINIIRNKIEKYDESVHRSCLEEEMVFWERRMTEFHEVANLLNKLKNEQDNVIKQEQIYDSMRTTELPGSKYTCWETMGTNFRNRKEYLKEKILEAAKSLLTFFTCRGTDRCVYTDNVGKYYVDEFNHQVYIFEYCMGIYHVNCEGEFQEKSDKDLHYFDEDGRYIYENGEKVYQCAPCTSRYKLADDTLLKKITMDCGHSEKPNTNCRVEIKDLTDVEILPKTVPVDIKRTLDSETVKYLWDNFGSLLPDALRDVALNKPKNPIHYLAHRLLYHKYSRTRSEVQKKSHEAEAYRSNIYKERKAKAIAVAKAWKAKQVRRRKPEESDDAQDKAVYEAQMDQREFINSLNYYN